MAYQPASGCELWKIETVVPVTIDVKPGSDRNPLNLNSNGVIPITVFTTDVFSALGST